MSDMSFEDAVAAIEADVNANPNPEVVPDITGAETVVTDQADTSSSDVNSGVPADTADSTESSWNIDINTLPDDIKPFAKSLQGDYTRKTQQLADMRKQYESYGDPESVAQAVALAQAFQSDPVGTLKKVEEGLREMGMYGEAPKPVTSTQPETLDDPILSKLAQEYGEDDPLFQLAKKTQSTLVELQKEKGELFSMQQEAERERAVRDREELLAKQELGIRQIHQDWDDEDIDAVYDLTIALGGDMEEAAKRYDYVLNRNLVRYLAKKSGQPTGTSAVGSSGTGTQVQESAKTFSEATKNAREELEALINSGDFSFGPQD